ncbi:ROK family protein [Brevibacillus sp. Leaf182]|uniref:ROK family protein n=1 Tax=Brevibacillus sp. Leaf182 TaxID=1736290 RepID=UPI0006FAC1E0|nr:ROK family protein [Brevibacillus sp. Leaf182]RAT94022.1 ROK family protein [Brevibacillus sp. Leaf182]
MRECLVTIDLGGSTVRMALVDLESATMMESMRIDLDKDTGPLQAISQMAGVISNWEELAQREIRGIVAGLAALHDASGTIVTWPNRPEWNGFAFRDTFAALVGKPIVLFDDANLGALGEYAFGLDHSVQQLLYVVVGTGIGSSLVLQGNLYTGARGASGELGHITVDPWGERCPCGGIGCLQMHASGRAIERTAQSKGLSITRASEVFHLASQGNETAQWIVTDSLRMLAIGIANAIRLFDPEVVVVGGGMASRFPDHYRSLEKHIQDFLGTLPQRNVSVKLSALGEDAALWGGIAYGLRMFGKIEELEGVRK